VGVGETEYRRWGGISDRSEFQLACEAIVAACRDAGLSPHELDGFASYSNDRNDAPRLAAALGCPELRLSSMVWDGGGGGVCAAVAHAAQAIHAGAASCVAVVRALCQGQYGRFGRVGGRTRGGQPASAAPAGFGFILPFGLLTPAQMCALIARRHMHEFGTTHRQMGHVALAARTHALRNPRVLAFLAVWFAVNLIFGIASIAIGADGASVAWQAHVGGFFAGLVLFALFDPVPRTNADAAGAA